jgi:hypothetical protein
MQIALRAIHKTVIVTHTYNTYTRLPTRGWSDHTFQYFSGLEQVSTPRYFIHTGVSIITPIASALKNYYQYGY